MNCLWGFHLGSVRGGFAPFFFQVVLGVCKEFGSTSISLEYIHLQHHFHRVTRWSGVYGFKTNPPLGALWQAINIGFFLSKLVQFQKYEVKSSNIIEYIQYVQEHAMICKFIRL